MTKKPEPAVPERAETPRAAIHAALLGRARTARELSARTSLREKDVAEHLEHLERSVRREGGRLVVEPAKCLACGFVFNARSSERIAPPAFRIETKSG